MYQRRIIFLSLFFCFHFLFSQENKDDYNRNIEELTERKRGPNLDFYSHFFIGYGYIVGPEEDSARVTSGKSSTFTLGYRFKKRLSKWSEFGVDATYHYSAYHIKQDSSKIIPHRTLHRKEKLVLNSVQAVGFTRFKFKNKHHSAGIFLDLGVYWGANYRIKHQTVGDNKLPGTGKTKTVNLKLNYTEDFVYGVTARFGFNRVVFYGRYRFSDIFEEDLSLPELPRYEAGILIGIHQ